MQPLVMTFIPPALFVAINLKFSSELNLRSKQLAKCFMYKKVDFFRELRKRIQFSRETAGVIFRTLIRYKFIAK